jgi:sec-independent protein translocase protein TatC
MSHLDQRTPTFPDKAIMLEPQPTQADNKMHLLQHLEELRRRLIYAILSVVACTAVAAVFAEDLVRIIGRPLQRLVPNSSPFVFTGLPDLFVIYLKVAFLVGILGAMPFILYQLWKFTSPGLYQPEKKLILPFVAAATLLFYLGAAFAYFFVFPMAFSFFLGLQTDQMRPMLSIREYLSLVVELTLAFGLIFETPVIIFLLGSLGIVTTTFLKKQRRYFIVLAFVVAAILTPPDVLSQTLMAIPLVLLFEISIQLLAHFEKKKAP